MKMNYKNIRENYNRTIVLGDIHGCFNEMNELLNQIGFCDSDLVVAVGDIIDRGPSSWKVANFFQKSKNAICVLGNHERRLLGTVRGTSLPAWSQLHSLSKLQSNEHEFWAHYFESLPAVIETPHVIVTHARLDPGQDVTHQDPYFTCAVGGSAIKIEVDEQGVPIWYYQWINRFGQNKPICIGHSAYVKVELVSKKLFALDTEAVKEGRLTAVILPECEIRSVNCQVNYYEKSRREWLEFEFCQQKPQTISLNIYFRILNKENLNEIEQKAVDRFNAYLDGLNIEGRISSLRERLIDIFGVIPPPGPKRGDYFCNITKNLAKVNQRVLQTAFSGKPFKIEKFLKYFQNKSLDDVQDAILKIEKWANDSSE
jgi:predicted phosphodiesterase